MKVFNDIHWIREYLNPGSLLIETSLVIILLRPGTRKLAVSCGGLGWPLAHVAAKLIMHGACRSGRERGSCRYVLLVGITATTQKGVASDGEYWHQRQCSYNYFDTQFLSSSHHCVLWQHLYRLGCKWHPINICWIKVVHEVQHVCTYMHIHAELSR